MKRSYHPIFCAHCGDEIEACDGAFGDWMHTRTRAEQCARVDGYATPEPPERAKRGSNEPSRYRVRVRA